MEKLFDLQRFGEETETPPAKTDAETNPTQDVETDVDFEDTVEDTTSQESKTEESKTKPQQTDKKQQARDAYQKRMEAKRKAEEERKAREQYIDGFKKASGGYNKFTQEPIEDEEDIREYEIMLELDKQGKDPIDEFRKYTKEQRKQERLQREQEEQRKQENAQKINDELKEMYELYGEAKTKEIVETDTLFGQHFDNIQKQTSFKNIYELRKASFEEGYAKAKAEFEDRQLESEARRMSSSGSVSRATPIRKSVSEMTDEEFEQFQKYVTS